MKRLLLKKEENAVKLQKIIFENHGNYSMRTSTKGRPFRTFNSYSFIFNGELCMKPPYHIHGMSCVHTKLSAREASSFCDFWKKLHLSISLHFIPFLFKQTFVFWDVLGNDIFRFQCILFHFYSSKRLYFEMCLEMTYFDFNAFYAIFIQANVCFLRCAWKWHLSISMHFIPFLFKQTF